MQLRGENPSDHELRELAELRATGWSWALTCDEMNVNHDGRESDSEDEMIVNIVVANTFL